MKQLAAKLLEGVVKSGWEVVSSAEFTTTPGFELVTWVFKKSVTPIGDGNGAVVALMLTPPNRSVMFAFFTMWHSRIVPLNAHAPTLSVNTHLI